MHQWCGIEVYPNGDNGKDEDYGDDDNEGDGDRYKMRQVPCEHPGINDI